MKIKKKLPLKSLSSGIVALVFLVVGFQAALFVHRAAVMKIVAGRDSPDTVIVYKSIPSVAESSIPSGNGTQSFPSSSSSVTQKTERHNSSHSDEALEVRSKVRTAAPSLFPFNPNEISVEDFVRLGFTFSRASSIDAYRKKGGVFRRKSDFARCRAVDDETFQRLEPYIDIPLLDINEADSAAFDALPGIGPYFASKFVSFRRSLGGYARKEQLLDVWKMDKDRYDKISDIIEVKKPYVYPLWSVGEDSLARHPYIRSKALAHSIVLFREYNPQDSLSVDALERAGVIDSAKALMLKRLFPEH